VNACCCTRYVSILAPPVFDGGFHDSVTLLLPGVAAGDSGALGTVRGTALTTVLGLLQPTVLWARIRK
jgi:hypothetical protein